MFIHINRHHTYSCTKTQAHVFIGCLLRFAEEKTPYQENLKMSWIKINERSQNSEVDAEHLKLKNQT